MTPSPAYLSAELLLERVWGEDVGPFTRAAPVTIGRLRRKLGQPQVIENGHWGGLPDSGLALGAEFVTRLARKEGETASCAECSVRRQREEPAGDRSTRLNDGSGAGSVGSPRWVFKEHFWTCAHPDVPSPHVRPTSPSAFNGATPGPAVEAQFF